MITVGTLVQAIKKLNVHHSDEVEVVVNGKTYSLSSVVIRNVPSDDEYIKLVVTLNAND